MSNIALYPGSFDPFTNGHLSVLKKAANIFDSVIVVISQNPAKKRRFDDMCSQYGIIKAIEKCNLMDKVKVCETKLTIPALIAKQLNCNYIIRGLRNNMDYNYEEGLAQLNKEANKDIETIYFRADNTEISSTMVYSFIQNNIDVKNYLPYDPDILKAPRFPTDGSMDYNSVLNGLKEYYAKVWGLKE
jgi:pantetheine-phosphate adenylyltransferase